MLKKIKYLCCYLSVFKFYKKQFYYSTKDAHEKAKELAKELIYGRY